MPKFIAILSLLFILGASACNSLHWPAQDEPVLARVHNKYLYSSSIYEIIQPGTSTQDSITIVANYINNWVQQQLLLFEAEKNLTQRQKDFSKQLEDYRNSLIVYEYESFVLSQKLDTVVPMVELQRYYDANPQNFELKENIVKVNYVQIENDSRDLTKLRRWWKAGDENSLTMLENYCIQNGLNYLLFDDSWIYFNDLLKEVPIKTYNQESFLKYNRSIEVRDSLYIYLVDFKDFKIKESVTPLSMVEGDIRTIIINRRKLELLQNLRNDIFENALNANSFEIY